MRPAVFLDRDGTVIRHVHHLTDPQDVKLIPGAARAIRVLRTHGYACVVVTNQSVIGRGMLTEQELAAVHDEMNRQLADADARVDAIYHCPVTPRGDDSTVIEHPERKPGPGMLFRASAELGIDLAQSWIVGDSISDLLAGRNAGCRGSILVRTGLGAAVPEDDEAVDYAAAHLLEAANLIASLEPVELKPPLKTGNTREKANP